MVLRMHVVARTSRQLLREFSPEDAAHFFALNSDPEVVRYTGDGPFESVEAARTFLEGYDPYRREGIGRWAAIEIATGEFLGWCGLRRQTDGEVDLGYRYRRAVWGRGFATEASQACVAIGFDALKLASIDARAHPDNTASIRVMQKLGFGYVGPSDFAGHPAVLYRLPRPNGSLFHFSNVYFSRREDVGACATFCGTGGEPPQWRHRGLRLRR